MDLRTEKLRGLRILVAEDEMLILMELEDMLEDLGCEVVGRASTVAAACAAIDTNALDGALLDINLRRESILPAAEMLRAQGVPFVLVTGYAGRLAETSILQDAPRLTKPFTQQALSAAMADAFTAQAQTNKPMKRHA